MGTGAFSRDVECALRGALFRPRQRVAPSVACCAPPTSILPYIGLAHEKTVWLSTPLAARTLRILTINGQQVIRCKKAVLGVHPKNFENSVLKEIHHWAIGTRCRNPTPLSSNNSFNRILQEEFINPFVSANRVEAVSRLDIIYRNYEATQVHILLIGKIR